MNLIQISYQPSVVVFISICIAIFSIYMFKQKSFKKTKLKDLKFQSLFENNLDPILIFNAKGQFVGGNKKALDLKNFETALFSEDGLESFVKKDERVKIEKHFQESLDGIANELSLTCVNQDGIELFYRIKNIPIVLEGKSEGFYSIVHDLTEQKRTEQKLLETSRLLESFFKSTRDAIDITTADSKVLYVNPEFEKMFGWREEEIMGKEIPIHISGDVQERKTAQKLLENNEPLIDYETKLKRKDGTLIDVSITLAPIMNEAGNLESIAAITRDISERKQYEAQLKQMAYYDPLTDIPNRRLFYDRLSQSIKKAKRNQSNFALFYLDCDHFKMINDTYGHDTGDMLLKGFVERVESCIRESDTLARLGGDEFAIILDGFESTTDVVRLAERMIQSLREPWKFNEHEFCTTSSIGISIFPSDSIDMDTLLSYADQALYHSKEKGRNMYQFYTDDLSHDEGL